MSNPSVNFEVLSLEAGTTVVSIAGDLDMFTSPDLNELLADVIGGPAKAVVVDFTDCEFIDSTALHVLVQARNDIGDREPSLSLVIPEQRLRRVFEITQLDHLFAIYPDRATALDQAGTRARALG